MSEDGKPKAVLYARVSTRSQSERGFSLRQQTEALRGWAEAEGYQVLEAVEDGGYSGASLERPGLDRVRDLVAEGGVSVVVAQDRDRLSREPAYLYLLKKEFAEYGTNLRAMNDRGDDSPEGELTDGILDQLAKFERAKTAERSRRGKARKVREGRIVRGPYPPYGFTYSEDGGSLVVDEDGMRGVRRIFRMLAVEGESLGGAARRLHEEGAPPPAAAGGGWHKSVVRRVAAKDLYRPLTASEVRATELVPEAVAAGLDPDGRFGLWVWRGRKGESPVAVPVDLADAGLDRALVDAARERVASNGPRRPVSTQGERYWQLSGGIVRCGACGCVLSPKARRRTTSGARGVYTDFWYCCRTTVQKSGGRACPNTRMHRAVPLEEGVWEAVHDLLKNPRRLQAAYEKEMSRRKARLRGDPEEEAKRLAETLAELDRKEEYLLDVASDTLMPREKLRAKVAALRGRRAKIEEELEKARGRRDAACELRREAAYVFARFNQIREDELLDLGPEDRRSLYMALRLLVEVDADGSVRISGVFDTDLAELLPVGENGAYRASEGRPEVPEKDRVPVHTPAHSWSSG